MEREKTMGLRACAKKYGGWVVWFLEIVAGCAIYALGFDLFLEPHNINAGGLIGIAMVFVYLTKLGSVGWVTLVINIPLFLLGWKSVGKKFFFGSLIGAVALSGWMELFEYIPIVETEPLLGALYGGVICGAGSGLVFFAGASTGGSDIIVRLLKMSWRNLPIGKIALCFDGAVVLLTGITFQNFTSILYCGITLYVSTQVLDAVVYSFDYSKVAIIISVEYERIADAVGGKLMRGATYLYGQKAYSGRDIKVVLTAIKRHQLAELKEMVTEIDPDAFVIIQESHQVLGDGFAHYSRDAL